MIVHCPDCRRGYRLDDQIAARRRALRCSACGCRFTSQEPARDQATTAHGDEPKAAKPEETEPVHKAEATGPRESPRPSGPKPPAASRPIAEPPGTTSVPLKAKAETVEEPETEEEPEREAEPETEDQRETAEEPKADAEPAPAGAKGPRAGSGRVARVVLADAGRPVRGVLKPLLEEMGCMVDLAPEGLEAFRLAVTRKPDLLIASVHLPGLSGVAICEGVKGSPHLKGIKVALVGSSLTADLFNRSTALAYGADLFLEEGMAKEALSREIAFLLGEGGSVGGTAPAALARERSAVPGDGSGTDAEIGMLARLMLSDLRLYYPDRYERAVREGNLFEVFNDELSKGRAMLDERYPQVPERHRILAAALKVGLEAGRRSGPPNSSGTRTG